KTYQRPREGCSPAASAISFTPHCSILLPGNGGNLPVYAYDGKRGHCRRAILPAIPNRDVFMIKRYSDHAANERTFLAWVRTAIAVMAFGFVIERFDLVLQMAAPQLANRQLAPHHQGFANIAGLAFIVLGVAMIVISGIRFVQT